MKQRKFMKKALVCLLCLLCIALSACANAQRPEYKVRIADASLVGDPVMDELLLANMGELPVEYQDTAAPAEKTATIEGTTWTAEYQETKSIAAVNHLVDYYLDTESQVELRYNHDTGALIGYRAPAQQHEASVASLTALSKTELDARARSFAASQMSIEGFTEDCDVMTYEDMTVNQEDLTVYYYTFFREVGNFRSSEGILVTLDEFGRLLNYNVYMPGLFDDFEMPTIDLDACNEAIEDYLDSIFCDDDSPYVTAFYDISGDYNIGLTAEGNIELSCSVHVDAVGPANDSTSYSCPLYVSVEIPA